MMKHDLPAENAGEMAQHSQKISARHLAEFASFVVESMSDGAFLIAKDASIVYVNKAACRQLGYTEEELLAKTILDINPEMTRERWDAVWGVTVNDKSQTIETTHVNKDGELLPVEIMANFIEMDGVHYSCTFTRDISERKKMEARLRQSEKMEAIGFLAGGIAHDFNNQLCGIAGYLDLLQIDITAPPASVANSLSGINTAVRRAAALTEQLLAFARQGKYLSVPVNVNTLVAETVAMLERSINKNIKIVTQQMCRELYTTGDPSQLENALLNLGINARDAMEAGGELTFKTGIVTIDKDFSQKSIFSPIYGTYVKICVSDTGVGMSKEVQQHVFEPFFTTKEPGKGTGMGLASVFGTVKSHHGAIEIRSDEGEGTDIMLYLPYRATPVSVENDRNTGEAIPTLEARILLVDDEKFLLQTLSEMLTRIGCHVTAARNGRDALRLYREGTSSFDVVLIDVIMPEMGGKETFLKMKEINPDVTAIIMSGYSATGEVQEILDAGAQGLLKKPFLLSDLTRTLRNVLPVG